MFLSNLRRDSTLYFSVVPKDVIEYTQQLWKPFAVNMCWSACYKLPHGFDEKLIAIATTNKNDKVVLGFHNQICVFRQPVPLIITHNLRDMVIDGNDHIWLCIQRNHMYCVLQYTFDAKLLTINEFSGQPLLLDLVLQRHSVSCAVFYDPFRDSNKCAVLSDATRVVLNRTDDKLIRYDASMTTVLNSVDIGGDFKFSRSFVVDANDNVIFISNERKSPMFFVVNKEFNQCIAKPIRWLPEIEYITVDKYGSVVCATENEIVVIETF